MIQMRAALAMPSLAPSSSPSTASSGQALAIAARMKRSTSRSIAVTSSCRPFSDSKGAPKAPCARRPASAAS
jgi:hypothetical protein